MLQSEQFDSDSDEDEITLSTEDLPSDIVLDRLDLEFEQSNKMRGYYRKLAIFNDLHCVQWIKNKHRRKYKFRFDLSLLDGRPTRKRHIAWKWLYSTLGFTSLTALMVYIGWFAAWISPSNYFLIAMVVLLCAAVISLLLFIHNTYDKVVFKSQYGQVTLVELINKYPDRASFRDFIAQFILQIGRVKSSKSRVVSKFLTLELQELRRLKDEQVISEEQYESAKAIIFQHSAFQSG